MEIIYTIKLSQAEHSFIKHCFYGNLHEANKVLETNQDIRLLPCCQHIFKFVCKNGHIHVAQWLYTLKPEIVNSESDWDEYAFRWACHNGYLDVAQWLFSVKTNINMKPYFHDIFLFVCMNGHLELAKWLQTMCNYWVYMHFTFRKTCEHGQLQIAQWLLTIYPQIQISNETEDAFRWACMNGHLHVAQWLLSVEPKINVFTQKDNAFILSCENGHTCVALWLQSLLPNKYDVVVQENKIISFNVKSQKNNKNGRIIY